MYRHRNANVTILRGVPAQCLSSAGLPPRIAAAKVDSPIFRRTGYTLPQPDTDPGLPSAERNCLPSSRAARTKLVRCRDTQTAYGPTEPPTDALGNASEPRRRHE